MCISKKSKFLQDLKNCAGDKLKLAKQESPVGIQRVTMSAFATVDTAIIRSSRLVLFYKKGVLTNSTNSQENTKKEVLAQIFPCEFCEISHNIFLKEPTSP